VTKFKNASEAAPSEASGSGASISMTRSTEADTSYGAQSKGPSFASMIQGRYLDLGRIARGAFGDVRRVRDTHLARVLAMKVMLGDIVSSPRRYARFVAEIELTAELQHPGVVPIHDCGELEDGRLWFTMQEVRGRTFSEVIGELSEANHGGGPGRGGSAFRRAVDVLARLSQTVAFAHGRGIIHRDIKPRNVMVGDLGEAFVMDWGLARRLRPPPNDFGPSLFGAKAPRVQTDPGEVLGTPAYMPPEQAFGEISLQSPASDVYSLGAILYHLLAGVPPYRGSRMAVLKQVRRGAPVRVTESAPEGAPLPPKLVAICERAMQRDPAARHADAGLLAQDLLGWLMADAAFADEMMRSHDRSRYLDTRAGTGEGGQEWSFPAGHCHEGGFVDAFVLRRDPVTHGEFLAFLNDLVEAGRAAEAFAHQPRAKGGEGGASEGAPMYERDARGHFEFAADPRRELDRSADVTSIDWHAAAAYASWYSRKTGLPWRLPDELELEVAARAGCEGLRRCWCDSTRRPEDLPASSVRLTRAPTRFGTAPGYRDRGVGLRLARDHDVCPGQR